MNAVLVATSSQTMPTDLSKNVNPAAPIYACLLPFVVKKEGCMDLGVCSLYQRMYVTVVVVINTVPKCV